MRKPLNKELVMIKEDDEDFENSTKYWICDNVYVDADVKVKDNWQITGRYRGSAYKDCNINIELNEKNSSYISQLKKP